MLQWLVICLFLVLCQTISRLQPPHRPHHYESSNRKMRWSNVIKLKLLLWRLASCYDELTPLEVFHKPFLTKIPLNTTIPGSGGVTIPPTYMTPDFREDEMMLPPLRWTYYLEFNRPYRISPFGLQYYNWMQMYWNYDNPGYFGCYLTLVYKRFTPLSMGAVITVRHVLTSAWPTYKILKRHPNVKRMTHILGWWYNVDENPLFNTTRFMIPARIHYHPKWNPPHLCNASHPYPVIFDLAVHTGLHVMSFNTYICQRGGPAFSYVPSSFIRYHTIWLILGCQFMKAYNRNPTPFHLYAVRTKGWIQPCPKVEWGWYHCVGGRWFPLGMDSGAPLHRCCRETQWWYYDGLIGMNTLTLLLRSETLVNYFVVLNTHPVLDFLYDSYMGQLHPQYLDERYPDTKWGPLAPYTYYYIEWKTSDPSPSMESGLYPNFWDGRK